MRNGFQELGIAFMLTVIKTHLSVLTNLNQLIIWYGFMGSLDLIFLLLNKLQWTVTSLYYASLKTELIFAEIMHYPLNSFWNIPWVSLLELKFHLWLLSLFFYWIELWVLTKVSPMVVFFYVPFCVCMSSAFLYFKLFQTHLKPQLWARGP